MQRAFSELERDGLVYTQRTSGRFVTEDAEVLKNLRKNLSKDVIEEMCTRLMRLGLSREEIRDAVDAWAERMESRKE
jgi:DNA-binding transcriptional regulator YhcF (GntR family)